MIYLIKGADVYAPHPMGRNDILISGNTILRIAESISLSGDDVQVIDAEGLIATPGFVDTLVHFSGGGGEGGFHTRTPEMHLTDATLAGVTTVIGALGTDAVSRTHTDLLAKAHGLDNEGLSTYCYSGSYQVPPRTVTGNLMQDIMLIDKFIGVGEIAIADHRSSQPTVDELARLASDARVGGMLAGKKGVVCIHMGDSDSMLKQLHEVIDSSDIPASQFYPTHINRSQALLDAGIDWTKKGGYVDMTTSTNEQYIDEGEIPAAAAIAYCLSQGVDVQHLTMSSDGNASLPVFDESGQLTGLEVGRVSSLHDAFCELVLKHDVPVEHAVACITRSPADILKLSHKGRLQTGADADLVLMKADDFTVEQVWCRGRMMVEHGKAIVRGTFE